MDLKKLPNEQTDTGVSCEEVQKIIQLNAENQDALVEKFTGKGEEVVHALLHMRKCDKCMNLFKKLKER